MRDAAGSTHLSQAEMQSALFAQLVMQQANMAFMLLGKTPHPETGKTVRDLEAAQLFIGQLEMLEAKTKGNLNRDEENLLKQTLMSLHMAFVEMANTPKIDEPAPSIESKTAPAESADAAKSDESGKRFSKTYPT
jgi:hypothetical protein